MDPFLFSLLFFCMGFFFLLVAGWAAYGMVRMLREGAETRRYLEGAKDDGPLELTHLSEPLRRFAMDTRLLRIALESPLRDVAYLVRGDLDRGAEDLDTFDTMLLNLSRQLTEWVATADRLSPEDRARLEDLGGAPAKVRAALEAEGWAFVRRNLQMPGRPAMDARLRAIVGELAHVEVALQAQSVPYR